MTLFLRKFAVFLFQKTSASAALIETFTEHALFVNSAAANSDKRRIFFKVLCPAGCAVLANGTVHLCERASLAAPAAHTHTFQSAEQRARADTKTKR
jgi:hypothetical protein